MLANKLLKKTFYYCGILAFIGLVVLGITNMTITADNKATQDKLELSSSGFIGKVVDREGTASIKPVLNDRWSVAEANRRLETGDLVMTGTRGANAIKLHMLNGVQLILGPDTLIEITNQTIVRLVHGEIEVTTPEKIAVKVNGFKEASIDVTGNQILRSRNDKLTRLTNTPAWLIGYKNDKSTEALGSLLANVDGRNVPLTIGYHKVTVDIRDQIARTEIEESFINTTNQTLEGVFYFPLPQDASISGFAMWIGDEMVQAEIVEKQRAREIYETILRERRDPGLLEWTGGNIFKARVFPITSEKRIKISYTQVLSKIGNTYRYNYALQSELLRLHPLKKLQLEVKVSSIEPLAKVESPSHSCRIDTTTNAAHVEFDASEYTPKQDFELDITTAPTQSNITLVSHKRANDGYFMLLVNSPQEIDNAKPSVLPNSSPTNFLIMADTSGSMAGSQRDKQINFIEALLSSLGAQDTFNLVTCDVTTQQAFNQAVVNTPENRERALQFLEKRVPLGWSDLNKAFSLTMELLDKQTQVIYVGDGIITRSNSDPVAFSKHLKNLYQGNGTFHAVATGSSYESAVLKSIASLGGGSVRFVGATDAAQTAFELLKEISSPVVKDLKCKFTGADIAAVYPDNLPNLPAGTQQFIVGRYNPATTEGKVQVVVSGVLNGQQIEYSQVLTLASENEGNSFIPRLWARQHLDHLLAEGASQQTKDKIITLSEDFQIITPYTSFLVLESDADRERFNVKKRFHMRDGEEFFATGRDNANFELARKQMIKARRYRTELQSQVLESLLDLKRPLTTQLLDQTHPTTNIFGFDGGVVGGVISDMRSARGSFGSAREESIRTESTGLDDFQPASTPVSKSDSSNASNSLKDSEADDKPIDYTNEILSTTEPAEPTSDADFESDAKKPAPKTAELTKNKVSSIESKKIAELPVNRRDFSSLQLITSGVSGASVADRLSSLEVGAKHFRNVDSRAYYYNNNNFDNLFPTLVPAKNRTFKTDWSNEILDIFKTLDRRQFISNSDNYYQIKLESEYTDKRNRVTISKGEFLLSKADWATIGWHTDGNDYTIDWYNNNERGVLSVGWLLGRSRTALKGDETAWSEPFAWYFGDTTQIYAPSYKAELKKLEAGKVSISLYNDNNPDFGMTLIIDTTKSVLVEQDNFNKNKLQSKTLYQDFIEINGAWWPQTIVTQYEGKITSKIKVSLQTPSKERFSELLAKTLTHKKEAVLLGEETQTLEDAKQQVKDQQAKLTDYWKLLKYFAMSQQWDKVELQLTGVAEIVGSKPGFNLIKLAVLQANRHNEELKNLLLKLSSDLTKHPREADYSVANQLLNYTNSLNLGNERMEILNILKPVYERQKSIIEAMQQWDQNLVQALQMMNRPEEVFAKQEKMAQDYPFNYYIQVNYANALASRGEIDAAVKYLSDISIKNAPWEEYELQYLKSTGGQILSNAYRLAEFVKYIEDWEKQKIGTIDQYTFNQYLSALISLNQEAKASKLIKEWLTTYRKEKLEQIEANKLSAAIQQALGQGHNFYTQRVEPEYLDILADTARYFSSHLIANNYSGQILQNYNFTHTDKGRALQTEFYRKLQHDVRQMSPEQIQHYFSWIKPYFADEVEGENGWQKILDDVFLSWQKEKTEQGKQLLGSVIISYGRSELRLNYYRAVFIAANTPEKKSIAAYSLFYALLGEKWSASTQNELLQLLPYFDPSIGEDPKSIDFYLDRLVVALHNFNTWLVQARSNAIIAALPNVNLTTRRELKVATEQAQIEARKAALELLTRLEHEFNPIELRPWLTIERLYLEVKLKANPEKIRIDTLTLLSAIINSNSNKTPKGILLRDYVLATRGVATLSYLAVQKNEKEAIEQLLSVFNKAIAENNQLLDWKVAKYQLLVALDRGNDVEAALKDWFGEKNESAKIRWGRNYAYILAERNQIAEAIKVFNQIEKEDELYFADYRTLADWYTVENLPEKAHEAKIKSWEVINEHEIYNSLNQELYKYQRQGNDIPSELDAEVPIKFVALLRKAQYPANYLYTISSFYQTTKDFRLLECIPEAMIGQSAQKIYPTLQQFSTITNLVQEEATIDRLEKQLQFLHTKAKSSVDKRALRLLEFMVERHATEQANGIELHASNSLRALKEAYKGEWADGEIELMAQFLHNQGSLKPETLANEQIRQLGELYSKTITGSYTRLVVASHFAGGLWVNNRQQLAINTLGKALSEYRQANNGILPQAANSQLSVYCSYLEAIKNYIEAENVWLKEINSATNTQQIYFLKQQLYRMYSSAIYSQAVVSFGTGEEFYKALYKRMLQELEERTNENQANEYIRILCEVLYNSNNLHYTTVKQDLINFAFERLPKILDTYNYRNGQSMVSQISYRLHDIAGALSALEFLVVRAENEPNWLRLQNQDFWGQHSSPLAQYRTEIKGQIAPELEKRLLKIVLKELRNDLQNRNGRNRNMYYIGYSYFWEEKKADFSRTAQEVLLENAQSEETAIYVAEYLYNGLKLHQDAIDALLNMHRKNLLGIEGQYKLCDYLQEQKRYSESVPILVKMVALKPERLEFRVLLMRGYFYIERRDLLGMALVQADKYFHVENRWQENIIATLGSICLETHLYREAIAYYNEAVALHVKTASNRGVGDGTLSSYYRNLAETYSGLSMTKEAVDAASGAIISWGQDKRNREYELTKLEEVLNNAKDLDSYVSGFEAEVNKSGLENPILRKALGKVYKNKGQNKKAEAQLVLAIENQPNDTETQRLLIEVYDRQGKAEQAINQLLAFTKLTSHDLGLYQQLGDRFAKAQKQEEAERAYTNMVEVMPNESESHQALAKIREAQNRWEDALAEWQEVIRVRTKEPTGYIGLAETLIYLKRWNEARKVISELSTRNWPEHFGNVKAQANTLNSKIPQN